MAQLGVIEKGIVNTSEKYTIAHSQHLGLKFIALKWADLKGPMKIDLGDTTSDDCNYRSTEERYSGDVVDDEHSALHRCYLVLLATFGLNRNPNFTF